MPGNIGFDAVEQAFHAMSVEAAAKYLEMGQMYAEMYPRPATIGLAKTRPDRNVNLLQQFGELSPTGMCLINWDTHLIEWSNGAYKKVFMDAVGKEALPGVAIGAMVPEFEEQGFVALFNNVATTGAPFVGESFPLHLGALTTYWDFSLTLFPSSRSETYLFLQMQRALAPALQSLAA